MNQSYGFSTWTRQLIQNACIPRVRFTFDSPSSGPSSSWHRLQSWPPWFLDFFPICVCVCACVCVCVCMCVCVCVIDSTCILLSDPPPHSGELRTQKLRFHLFRRTQSSKVLPLKLTVGQYVDMHATPTAKNFFLANFYPSCPFTCIFFQNVSRAFPV